MMREVIDPTIIPWVFAWLGLLASVCGMVLGWHGIGQRNPSKVADIGHGIAIAGNVVIAVVFFVNAAALIAYACYGTAENITHAAQPKKDDAYR